jgi:protoheme IX farnesyltransferase
MTTGYFLAYGDVSWTLAGMIAGVFLVACGSAAINNIQDRNIDALMERTKRRPLPTGRVSVRYAWNTAIVSVVAGLLLIGLFSNATAVLLGLLTVFWYNAVYTPLKRVTAFAAVPGGVVGAIPPIIGWVAGGGSLVDPKIAAVALFFFIWQVPHFWLLLLFSVGKDYERAGLPSLTKLFGLDQIARMTFVWIFATAVTCLIIPLFGIVNNPWLNLGLAVAGLWLVWRSGSILRSPAANFAFRQAFRHINIYVCWVISLLSVNGIIA